LWITKGEVAREFTDRPAVTPGQITSFFIAAVFF
jgi:hypothetical protein